MSLNTKNAYTVNGVFVQVAIARHSRFLFDKFANEKNREILAEILVEIVNYIISSYQN